MRAASRSQTRRHIAATCSLTKGGRRLRNLLTVCVLAGTVAGTVWGQDDHFPFAPFRMYSTTTNPSGRVTLPYFVGVTVTGATHRFETEELGLRTAEVLGQMKRFRRNPTLLQQMARANDSDSPPDQQLVRLRLVQEVHKLKDGRLDRKYQEVVSEWRAR